MLVYHCYIFYFHPYLGKIPILTSYFSKGLVQPPTSFVVPKPVTKKPCRSVFRFPFKQRNGPPCFCLVWIHRALELADLAWFRGFGWYHQALQRPKRRGQTVGGSWESMGISRGLSTQLSRNFFCSIRGGLNRWDAFFILGRLVWCLKLTPEISDGWRAPKNDGPWKRERGPFFFDGNFGYLC